jgi:hypothetical protein
VVDTKAVGTSTEPNKDTATSNAPASSGQADLFLQELASDDLLLGGKDKKANALRDYMSEMWYFFLATDGILMCIFAVKIYYGVRLTYKMIRPGRATEESLMDDKERIKQFEIRVLGEQRDYLYNYLQYTVFFYRYAISMAFCLSYVVYNYWHQILKLSILVMFSCFLAYYAENKMNTLIKEMNHEI